MNKHNDLHVNVNMNRLMDELSVEEFEEKIAPADKKCEGNQHWDPQMGQCVSDPIYIIAPPKP